MTHGQATKVVATVGKAVVLNGGNIRSGRTMVADGRATSTATQDGATALVVPGTQDGIHIVRPLTRE